MALFQILTQNGTTTSDPASPAWHALVDKAVAEHLDPLIKQAVLANRNVIPGLDLAKALGVEQ